MDRLVKDIKLSETDILVNPDKTYQLGVTITPADAFVKDVVWSSFDTDIATVDNNGLVTGHAVGTTYVNVTTTDGSDLTATCKVTVAELVQLIAITPDKVTLKERDSIQLEATVAPENAQNKGLVWSSLNPEIATVDGSGFVAAITPGTTQIKATAIDRSE